MSRKTLLYQLYLTPGVGNITMAALLQQLTDAEAADITPYELAQLLPAKRQEKFITAFSALLQTPEKIKYLQELPHVTFLDEAYSPYLIESYRFPCLLFYQGNLSLLQEKALSVVGTRSPVANSRAILRRLIGPLVKEWVIVSGLARGIDALAHETALTGGGATIACLGTGLDIFYPAENAQLQKQIGEKGLLLSEYLPQLGPKRHHFPLRNRIIAGLSCGTLVVAAKERSGSLITAQLALENNREVFALPGNIMEGNFAGCHWLIQQGAKCVQNSQDIEGELKFF